METDKTLDPIAPSAPALATAIDRWLAARRNATTAPTGENQHTYNATYYALGEAWAHRYPEAATMQGAFEWYLRGIAASETDE